MSLPSFRRRIQTLACVLVVVAVATPSQAFDTKWHADATRLAMEKHGFSADARLMCQFANYLTDYFAAGDYVERLNSHLPAGIPKSGGLGGVDPAHVARLHFDALTNHTQVEYQWKTLEQNTKHA